MSVASLKRWVTQFRKDARADQYALLRKHLRRLDLPDQPELFIEDTIQIVIACVAYASMDGQRFTAFLDMQCYNPSEASDAKYMLTFDLCGKGYARILVPPKFTIPDLADLYGHPWEEHRVCGYHSISISRIDRRKMGPRDITRLEQAVTYDLRFDYSEEELELWFDDQSQAGVLKVFVQDHYSDAD